MSWYGGIEPIILKLSGPISRIIWVISPCQDLSIYSDFLNFSWTMNNRYHSPYPSWWRHMEWRNHCISPTQTEPFGPYYMAHIQLKPLPIFQIGDLIRYAGSLCAAIYMYLLPCLVKLIDEKKENGKISIISMIIHCIIILYGTANFVLQFAVEAY